MAQPRPAAPLRTSSCGVSPVRVDPAQAQRDLAARKFRTRCEISRERRRQPGRSRGPAAAIPGRRFLAALGLKHLALGLKPCGQEVWPPCVVLRNISFRIPHGSMRVLLGASGAGKSITLKLILGLLRPDSGTIFVNGQRIDDMRERDLLRVRADIGMLFQESALFDSLTVAENVGYRLDEETDMPADQVRSRVEEALAFIGLGEYIDRMLAALSGGQRRRVAIARAIASKPSLVLFDDPTTGRRGKSVCARRNNTDQAGDGEAWGSG